ncbi:uncharacterized protein LAESUDRAFT_743455 [Laetiporus sulphureus 93-53]|uniref:CCHC-type domain-containing protein n=1 Tax=Laetiporus sulphureus 93-53 TaxID=1314785 RepID=A0A165E5P1_9APHY|nr:uncharacterized protein LAESUDRAFT_743455 [Laetiporus sulphureus 93-53]KZT06286.1 hypothetical protein LAESUDRAFT_743455 [Laetiporus sulphureus 93-53]
MTRYTNLGRKRTYVQAGLNYRDDIGALEDGHGDKERTNAPGAEEATIDDSNGALKGKQREGDDPAMRKAKRQKLAESANASAQDAATEEISAAGTTSVIEVGSAKAATKDTKKRQNKKRSKDAEARKEASERRRLKRRADLTADIVCFACREKGHAARDCTKAISLAGKLDEEDTGHGRSGIKTGRNAVGICYRCGSRRHNLSRCKHAPDPSNPLPFASCFVCSGKGHLASTCPQNQSKGVYPNGGCCKLCGETTHLAKDCALRKNEVAAATVFLGTGNGAGADEDDFHTFKRKNSEIDKSEKVEERLKKQAKIKVGAHSGVVKSFGKVPVAETKKVVYF